LRLADEQRCPADPGPPPRRQGDEPPHGHDRTQSVKTTEQGGPLGKDASKKVNGPKRHLVVDTLGMVVAAVVHSAGIPDRDGARRVLKKMVGRFPRLKKILAGGIDDGDIAEWARKGGGGILEWVVRPEGEKEFKVLPGRWIVERTFAWLGRYRPMSQLYEGNEESSEFWIDVAMTHLLRRRLDPAEKRLFVHPGQLDFCPVGIMSHGYFSIGLEPENTAFATKRRDEISAHTSWST
jgi:putative transposase